MERCPKCGKGSMQGPKYRGQGGIGGLTVGKEHLEYWCDVCGYRARCPCKDDLQRYVEIGGRRLKLPE